MPRLQTLWYELEWRAGHFDKNVLQSRKGLKDFTDFASQNMIPVIGAIGTAAALTAAKLAQFAVDYQKQLAQVRTVTDTTKVSLEQLSRGILRTFSDLPVENLNELTKGLYDILSAGIPATEALELLDTAARSAVGGVTDVSTAVNALTAVLNAYKNAGLTATEASDQLFQAVAKGDFTFGELAEAIGQVAPIASGVGVSLRDVLAAMAQITLSGQSVSQAAIGVRSALVNILNPTGKLAEQFPELAKQFNRTRLAGDGFIKFLLDFNKAANGNKAALDALFTDVQGKVAVYALLKDSGQGVAQTLDAITNSAGSAESATKTMLDTTAALQQKLRNELSVSLLELGTKLLPAFTSAVKLAVETVDFWTGSTKRFNEEIKIQSSGATVASLGALVEQFRRGGDVAGRLANAFVVLRDANAQGTLVEALRDLPVTEVEKIALGARNFAENLGKAVQVADVELVETLDALAKRMRTAADEAKRAQDALSGKGGAATGKPPLDPDLVKRQQALLESLQNIVAQNTTNLADDLALAIDRLEKQIRETGIASEQAAPALRALRAELGALKATEVIDPGSVQTSEEALRLLNDLYILQLGLTKGSKAHEVIQQKINALEARRTQLLEEEAKLGEEMTDDAEALGPAYDGAAKSAKSLLDLLVENVDAIAEVARGAIGLAQALGLADSNAAALLQNVITVAETLPKALSGDPTAIAGFLGGLGGLIGGLFGGESPEERARREALARNTLALEVLAREVGNAGLGFTGSEFAKFQEFVQRITSPDFVLKDNTKLGNRIDAELRKLGLNRQDLEDAARELGLEFRNTAEFYRQFAEAIKQTELTQFTQTFVGQLDSLRDRFELFDLTDPIKQLEEISKLAGSQFGSPAIAAALKGLDLSTPEGRAAAERAIQALFEKLQTGALTPGELGDLTLDQFRDLLKEIERLIDASGGAGDAGVESFVETRSITEVTGNRLLSRADSQVALLQDIDDQLRQILGVIRAVTLPGGPVAPPNLAGLTATAGGGGVIVQLAPGAVVVQLGPGATPAEAEALGTAAGTALVQQVQRELGIRARQQSSLSGVRL